MLKKAGLDLIFKNLRRVSNLPLFAKLMNGQLSVNLVLAYCAINMPPPESQSSYRTFHSTETALLTVQSDTLMAMDWQEVSLLIVRDLSIAFDTIDHSILLDILENDYGIVGNAQKWAELFLSARKQQIVIKQQLSKPFDRDCGVPQGSCLGSVLFLLYTCGLFKTMAKHLPGTTILFF